MKQLIDPILRRESDHEHLRVIIIIDPFCENLPDSTQTESPQNGDFCKLFKIVVGNMIGIAIQNDHLFRFHYSIAQSCLKFSRLHTANFQMKIYFQLLSWSPSDQQQR